MRRLNLKLWEAVLVTFAVLLFFTSFTFYVTDFPLRKYLFGLSNDDETKILIGQLVSKTGSLKRQLNGETEYTNLDPNSSLYNMDILLTGPDSKASLQFENGGGIELGPNTMVKLDFQTEIAFDGITRYGKLNVVAGSVQGQAGKKKILITSRQGTTEIQPNSLQKIEIKDTPLRPTLPPVRANRTRITQQKNLDSPTSQNFSAMAPIQPPPIFATPPAPSPSPSPSPSVVVAASLSPEQAARIKIVRPKKGEILRIEDSTSRPAKVVNFEWTMAPPNGSALLTLRKVDSKSKDPSKEKSEPIYQHVFEAKNGKTNASWKALSPGLYEWEITSPEGNAITYDKFGRSQFIIEKEFDSIKPLPTLVAGTPSTSNKLNGDLLSNFDITLRWEPVPDVDEYTISFTDREKSKKVLLQRVTKKPEFKFNKDRIFTGQLYYKVTARLESGFIASTGVQKFSFNFSPPVQVVPENNSLISKTALKKENNRLLMTWQKTNFTLGYEIEIGTDPEFKQKYLKKSLKENYYIFPNPPAGNYWWRVRSFTKELSSPMSQAFSFKIIP